MKWLLLCLVFAGCYKDYVLEPEYVTVVDPPEELTVSVVGEWFPESTGGGLFVMYGMGSIRNENAVDITVIPSLQVWQGSDSVLTTAGVIGHGRPADILSGLIDTVDFIPAYSEAEYFVRTQTFTDGNTATAYLKLEVKER